MSRLLNKIVGFFSYSEPKSKELGFELLEDESEGSEESTVDTKDSIQKKNKSQAQGNSSPKDEPKKQQSSQKNGSRDQDGTQNENKKSVKAPITVEEWNQNKQTGKNGDACRLQEDSDEISKEYCISIETLRRKFLAPKNQDIIFREFKIGRKTKAFIAYIEGMADKNTLNLAVLPRLMSKDVFDELGDQNLIDYLMECVLSVNSVKKTNKYSDSVTHILNGISALFVDGCSECILIENRGFEKRNVEQPVTETVVKGSQEGFTENLRTNVTLVRRIIRNENLVTEMLPVGNTNHANCAIMYLQGVANPKVVQEVKKRLKRIDTDFVLGDGTIEQFIEDNSLMLFPQIIDTERPDRTASFIMEGQVVVITEGSPFSLAVPVTFFRLFHTAEDTFVRWPASNFLRFIRLFGLFCATFLPGMYVALMLFHTEMVPTELLLSIARAKETVPFPTIVEILIMEISFELIREGGIRVPSVIGQTLGIVGALILGQAAVAAGLVSPMLVIVVSVTGLGAFAIPNYTLSLAVRIERFLFIFAGTFLGFYGIALMAVLLSFLVCSMKSFGVPFLSPVAPKTKSNRDVVLRYPIWSQKNRSDFLNTTNRKRQGNNPKLWIRKGNANNDGGGDKS